MQEKNNHNNDHDETMMIIMIIMILMMIMIILTARITTPLLNTANNMVWPNMFSYANVN